MFIGELGGAGEPMCPGAGPPASGEQRSSPGQGCASGHHPGRRNGIGGPPNTPLRRASRQASTRHPRSAAPRPRDPSDPDPEKPGSAPPATPAPRAGPPRLPPPTHGGRTPRQPPAAPAHRARPGGPGPRDPGPSRRGRWPHDHLRLRARPSAAPVLAVSSEMTVTRSPVPYHRTYVRTPPRLGPGSDIAKGLGLPLWTSAEVGVHDPSGVPDPATRIGSHGAPSPPWG